MAPPGQANVSLSARFGIDTSPHLIASVKEDRDGILSFRSGL
jgi:hypothetical protein